MAIEVDQKLIFPDQFDLKENPDYDDALMIYDAKAGKVKQTKMEAIQAAAGNNVIGSMTPSGSPSGSEVAGQSYRVSNTTGAEVTYTNFLTNVPDGSGGFLPVTQPDKTSGYLMKNSDGWVFSDVPVDMEELTMSGGFEGTSKDLDNRIKGIESGDQSIFGGQDALDTYISNSAGYVTRINTLKPIEYDGELAGISLFENAGGNILFTLWEKQGDTTYSCVAVIPLLAAIGLNNFVPVTDYPITEVKKGWYIGVTQLTGQATTNYKAKTGGSVSVNTAGNPVSIGSTFSNFVGANNEFAVSCIVQGYGLQDQIDKIVESNPITEPQITYKQSSNLAVNIISDMGINSTGEKQALIGWKTLRILKDDLGGVSNFVSGRFSIDGGGYMAFYNSSEVIGALGSTGLTRVIHFDNNSLPLMPVFESDEVSCYIDIARATNPDTDNEFVTVNAGSDLLDYEKPGKLVEKILGNYLLDNDSSKSIPPNLTYLQPLPYQSVRKATFSFIHDDLNVDTDETAYNLYKSKGLVCSFALTDIDNRMNSTNMANYLKWYKDGFRILNHTMTHQPMGNSTALTYQEAQDQIFQLQLMLETYGIKAGGFVTPYSILNPTFYPIIDQLGQYAFTTDFLTSAMDTTVDPKRLGRISMEVYTLDEIKAYIDDAITNKQLITFYGHKLPGTATDGDGNILDATKLGAILDYVKTKSDNYECNVMNTDDAINSYYKPTWAELFTA